MFQDPFITHLTAKYKTPAFTDAVGVGSIFGPIMACAVAMSFEYFNSEVNDSKKLAHKDIYRLAPVLKEKLIWTIGIVSGRELLDIKNNLKGEHIAMARAVVALKKKIAIDAVFVDGKYTLPKTEIPSYAVIKGDAKVYGIAAASIIAKNERDQLMMVCYGEQYSKYHIKDNKGYRSPAHLMAIRRYGPVYPHHRTYLPQMRSVMTGGYDHVLFSKYKDRWEKLCEAS